LRGSPPGFTKDGGCTASWQCEARHIPRPRLIECTASDSCQYAPVRPAKPHVSTALKPFHLLISGFGVRVRFSSPRR
jgi:hypothetical protein